MPATLSLATLGVLVAIPFAIALGQLLFKLSSNRLGDAGLVALATEPLFLLALALYGGATVVWLYVLKSVPLSYAYSFMALTYVAVPVMSWLWLGETMSLRYMVGMAVIIVGLVIVTHG